jgi:hypothetical protein
MTDAPSLAERVGFEPTDDLTTVNALAGRPIRPLWHLSSGSTDHRRPNPRPTTEFASPTDQSSIMRRLGHSSRVYLFESRSSHRLAGARSVGELACSTGVRLGHTRASEPRPAEVVAQAGDRMVADRDFHDGRAFGERLLSSSLDAHAMMAG